MSDTCSYTRIITHNGRITPVSPRCTTSDLLLLTDSRTAHLRAECTASCLPQCATGSSPVHRPSRLHPLSSHSKSRLFITQPSQCPRTERRPPALCIESSFRHPPPREQQLRMKQQEAALMDHPWKNHHRSALVVSDELAGLTIISYTGTKPCHIRRTQMEDRKNYRGECYQHCAGSLQITGGRKGILGCQENSD